MFDRLRAGNAYAQSLAGVRVGWVRDLGTGRDTREADGVARLPWRKGDMMLTYGLEQVCSPYLNLHIAMLCSCVCLCLASSACLKLYYICMSVPCAMCSCPLSEGCRPLGLGGHQTCAALQGTAKGTLTLRASGTEPKLKYYLEVCLVQLKCTIVFSHHAGSLQNRSHPKHFDCGFGAFLKCLQQLQTNDVG